MKFLHSVFLFFAMQIAKSHTLPLMTALQKSSIWIVTWQDFAHTCKSYLDKSSHNSLMQWLWKGQ